MSGNGSDPRHLYRQQQVTAMEPRALLLFTMDTAVRAARQGRRGLLIKVLHELLAGLDLRAGEVARNLFSVYEYLLRLTREGNLEEARVVLEELRDTWRAALAKEVAKDSTKDRGVGRAGSGEAGEPVLRG